MTTPKTHAKSASDIRTWLIAQLSQQLDIPAGRIDTRRPFLDYGLSSREAIVLSGDMSDWLGEPLSPTIAYDYPTIEALSEHLSGVDAASAADADAPAPITEPSGEHVAVVGIGCRFPGASDPDAYWDLLYEGRDAVRAQPIDRRNGHRPSGHGAARAGFIDGIDRFDAAFFGIAPREAASVDPQQRLVLEVAWNALEHAGIAPDSLAGSEAGVFIGISSFDFAHLQSAHERELEIYATTGSALSVAANRLSYCLDLRGPSLAIDTACSSSLVAVHQACQSLRNGECDLALAGGVNVLLNGAVTEVFAKSGMLARDGRCKTFDARADGYVRGEGCGIVVLRRLSGAVRHRNEIFAIIRGSAVNHDGRSNGLTAPNGPAQESVIRRALRNAGVRPAAISYVETHGTGTALGDPIEVRALRSVLMEGRPPTTPCWLGSVKSNIGHLEAAAGIAGFIKVVMALRHGVIPQNLHFETLNPGIALGDSAISVASERLAWPAEPGGRKASVSSFGFGGANAHVVLEEAPRPGRVAPAIASPAHLLALSAKSEAALREVVGRYAAFLETHRETGLSDICYTAAVGRSHFHHRAVVVAETRYRLTQQLSRLGTDIAGGLRAGGPRLDQGAKLAFLFTDDGSGSVRTDMDVYDAHSAFRMAADRCAEILTPLLSIAVTDVLGSAARDPALPNQAACAYVASFVIAYSVAELWKSWGITPSAVMGRGVGEYAAACVAGVFNLEDALRLVCERAKLMDAAHSALERPAASVCSAPPRMPVVSAITGQVVSDQMASAAYWNRAANEPVNFAAGLRTLHEHGCSVFLEIGADADLATIAGECLAGGSARLLPGLRALASDGDVMLESLGALYECGAHIEWAELYRRQSGRCVALPTYPFQREQYWPDGAISRNGHDGAAIPARSHAAAAHPLLGQRLGELAHLPRTQVWQNALDLRRLSFLKDHQLCGTVVIPHGVYVEMALSAGEQMFGRTFSHVAALQLHEALVVPEEHRKIIQTVASMESGEASFAVYSRGATDTGLRDPWTLHATATLHSGSPPPPGHDDDLRLPSGQTGSTT